MVVESCTLLSPSTMIRPKSPRSDAPGAMKQPGPTITSPISEASG